MDQIVQKPERKGVCSRRWQFQWLVATRSVGSEQFDEDAALQVARCSRFRGERVSSNGRARILLEGIDGSPGSVKEPMQIVEQMRVSWWMPRILVRGVSGFCREEHMT